VECDERGINPDPARCNRAEVRRFPTWLIAGQRFEGVMTLDELAQASGYRPSTTR
jgi:hypothetical protein